MEGSNLGSAHWGDLVGCGLFIVEWKRMGAIVESHQDERFADLLFFLQIFFIDFYP